jgi:sugar lactone lactonase YvrE
VGIEPSGLVNVARYRARSGSGPDVVLARTTLRASREGTRELRFGYSDAVAVVLNGRLLFRADSSYRGRDPSFLGIIGLNDALYLPLKEGENELLLMVVESFGGWGFMAQLGDELYLEPGLEELWSTERVLRTPESAVYDPVGGALYVSGYDAYRRSTTSGLQSVSKVSLDGTIESLTWVDGLFHPTGMAIRDRVLLVVDRGGLVEIDLDAEKIVGRRTVPGAIFLNDIALDGSGRVYLSDSAGNAIYRLEGDRAEAWLREGEIARPNGLHVTGGSLLVGNNGDGSLKSVDLETGEIRLVARLGPGVIDGISSDAEGNYLVSHWEGRLFRITPEGAVTKILDTTNPARRIADFAFIPGRKLLAVPSFTDNRLTLYRLP